MDKTLELADINAACFLSLQDIPISLTTRAGRVYFIVPADDQTYRELARLQSNPPVPALDFINRLKRLRSQMLDARDNGNGARNGYRNG
jgi:hypothetical protein